MLNRVRQPFNVNTIALAAAAAALDDARAPRSARSRPIAPAWRSCARGLRCARCAPSAVGRQFRADRLRAVRPAPVYEAMLRQGVIVRPRAATTGCRIICASRSERREQNERMLAALAVLGAAHERTARGCECDGSQRIVRGRSTASAGAIRVPGDKSISHRALMLGGIAEGVTRSARLSRKRRLPGDACEAMRALGVQIEQTGPRGDRGARRRVARAQGARRTRSTWGIPARPCA